MAPSVGITTRQDYLVGNQERKMKAERDKIRQDGGKPPRFTKYMYNHEAYAFEHKQETAEWRVDSLEYFEVREMSDNDAALMFPAGRPTQQVIIAEFVAKECPSHSHRRGLDSRFSPRSQQAELMNNIVTAEKKATVAFSTHKHLAPLLATWRKDVLLARLYSPYENGVDDWWPSRHQLYDRDSPKTYNKIIDSDIPLDLPPWLMGKTKDGVPTYGFAHAVTNAIPRTSWPTMKSVAQHFIPALMWERQGAFRVEKEVFNTSVKYPAVAHVIDSGNVKFDVKLANAALKSLPKSAIPRADTTLVVYVEGISDQKPIKGTDRKAPLIETEEDYAFVGALSNATTAGFDMSINAKVPQELAPGMPSNPIVDGQHYDVWITCAKSDFTSIARIKACDEASAMSLYTESKLAHGQQRGNFKIENLYAGTKGAHWSPNFFLDWLASPSHNSATEATIHELRTRDMTDEQQQAPNYILHDAFADTSKLQGFPGSGKTTTLPRAIDILMLMGKKVLME